MEEAEYVYDQLSALSPIFLAMSASSPIWRGYLADTDTSWPNYCKTTCDRTPEQKKTIPKSRWDSTECYISKDGQNYNDEAIIKDEKIFRRLLEEVKIRNFLIKLLIVIFYKICLRMLIRE